MIIRPIIQARIGSSRLPGKVMYPFGGETIIRSVIRRVEKAGLRGDTVVAIPTTDENDCLAAHVESLAHVVRGLEDDVAHRFGYALDEYPCDAFVRICADSPLIDPELIISVASMLHRVDADVASTVGQGFPPGQQVECIRTECFTRNIHRFDAYEREHVTPWFYRNPRKVRIRYRHQWPHVYEPRMVVDTREDYERMVEMI